MLTGAYVFFKNICVKVIQSDYSVNEGSFCCKLKLKNHQSGLRKNKIVGLCN